MQVNPLFPEYYNFLLYDLAMTHIWPLTDVAGTSGSNSVTELVTGTGGTPTGVTFGQQGLVPGDSGCARFNGSSDLIDTNIDNGLDYTGDLTLMAMVQTDTTASAGHIISKINNTDGAWPFHWAIVSGGAQRFNQRESGQAQEGHTSTDTLPANQVFHLAMTRTSGGTVTFYFNAVADSAGSGTLTTTASANTETAKIGREGEASTGFFDGRLQYVCATNAVLTTDQITLAANYATAENLGLYPRGPM